MTTPGVPDFPPRELRIYITPGEEVVVEGEESFAVWELDAIYSDLLRRPDPDPEPEVCPNCGEVVTHSDDDGEGSTN